MANNVSIAFTGVEALDKKLRTLAAEEGAKGINAAMRTALREAVKTIVLPVVLELIPYDTGNLEENIKVRAIKRARGKIGYTVGFEDPLFVGDTFYGGFIEFGFDGRGGVYVEADSFLRRALYPNADIVIDYVRARLQTYIMKQNRH